MRYKSVRSSLAELDVELVETLLAELDATQREIKEIKTRLRWLRRRCRVGTFIGRRRIPRRVKSVELFFV
jgi:hypothetical protein